MYDNEFRLVILLVGFFIIFYIVFINKSNRKYKVYKTKNYDIKKPIEIRSHKEINPNKNIDISLRSSINNNKANQEIPLSNTKPRQMSLSLGANETKSLLVIYSIAKNHYNIKDIYDYMDKKSIFWGIILGIPNYLTLLYFIKSLKSELFSSYQVFPIVNIGVIVMCTSLSVILFQEKVSIFKWVGVGVGILAISLILL